MQDVPQLVEHRGGNVSFVKSLEDHFNGGHNQHTNEVGILKKKQMNKQIKFFEKKQPSHHIPYLYALAGAALRTQERVRSIASTNYDNTPLGLPGVCPLDQPPDRLC